MRSSFIRLAALPAATRWRSQPPSSPARMRCVTTPGATKWYKANGRAASQRVQLSVSGALEWLPQEAIVFDQADVRSAIDIDLDADAAMIGWDIVALGRRAAGERFERGRYAQSIRLRIDDALVWHERSRILGGDPLLDSADRARRAACLRLPVGSRRGNRSAGSQ